MTATRFQQVVELFTRVRRASAVERAGLLEALCGDDAELRREVEGMLAADEHPLDLEPPEWNGAPQDWIPERIGPYRVVRLLAEGGMGVVYEAEQEGPSRRVALKVIHPRMVSRATRRRFEYEAEVLGTLVHPGIARIYAAGTAETGSGPLPYFAMEYVEGPRINDFVRSAGLGVRATVELFARVCDAVQHAHQNGVIHRDLKPANILVSDAEGAQPQPKVLDFGVARSARGGGELASLRTHTGEVVGTLAYMSPEQVSARPEELDTRSDVYALGVLLYELLTLRLPYELSDVPLPEAARLICEARPPRLGTVRGQLPSDLEVVVAKALEKDKERRYGSARELAADLRRVLRDEPIVARPPSALYELRKFAARNPILVTSGGLTVATLLAGIALSVVALRRVRAAEADARGRLSDFNSLASARRLDELLARSEDLWPALPEQVPRMDRWLGEARALSAELPGLRRALVRWAGDPGAGPAPEPDAWMHEQLTSLIGRMEAFCDPMAGAIAEMERRLSSASTLWQRSVGDHLPEWDAARRAIAASETYEGLELEPLVGLVPLGNDPASGLAEFWHVESGNRPPRDEATGALVPGEHTGIVLVLLPGGTCWFGAQRADPAGPSYDPQADDAEGPPRRVSLPAFLMSKYELTQGQWLRLTGENPSWVQPGHVIRDKAIDLRHPVESVSWAMCERTLFRAGLALPWEVEWEYAARAGTETPWWTGAEKELLEGAANLRDVQFDLDDFSIEAWLDDEYSVHAPVGSYEANAFGLHDVAGNVLEACADWFDNDPARPVQVSTPPAGFTAPHRVFRGGSFFTRASDARSTTRHHRIPSALNFALGARPVLRLQ